MTVGAREDLGVALVAGSRVVARLDPDHDGGDVVVAARGPRRGDEVAGGLVRVRGREELAQHRRSGTSPLRPSLHSRSTSPGAQVGGELVELRTPPRCPSALLRMLRCGCAAASSLVSVPSRTISPTSEWSVAQLLEPAVAQQVGAAVTDVDEARQLAVDDHRGERRPHARFLGSRARRAREDGVVRRLRRGGQRVAGGEALRERLDGQRRRDLAGLGAAHAVADDEEGRRRHVAVLVRLPVQTDVGEGGVLGDEGHRRLIPRSGRRSRRSAHARRA